MPNNIHHARNNSALCNPRCANMIRYIALVLMSYFLIACQNFSKPDNTLTNAEQTLFNQANASLTAGKADLAIQQFNQLLKSNPSAKSAYTNLGLSYINKDDDKHAKQAFLNAINQDKHDAIAYNHLAIIQRREGMFQLALGNYRKAIDVDHEYANAHLNLGILYDIYLQEFLKAREHYIEYQHLTNSSNNDIDKWLADLQRRIDKKKDGNND